MDISHSHCSAIAILEDVEVTDPFEEKRRQYMDKYNTPKGYVSHTELLEGDQIEAVAEVLGHHLHHRLMMDSCYASRHLLVEKPMTAFLRHRLKSKELLNSGDLGLLITAVSYMSKEWVFHGDHLSIVAVIT